MRRAQRAAVDLFSRHGFESVTVEQIAAAAQISPVSVYRYFGTKENVVIWDEYDPPIFEGIQKRLPRQRPLLAIRDALTGGELERAFDRERELVLERTRLMFREPALLAAADRNARLFRQALTMVLLPHTSNELEARTLAAVALGLLTVAVEEWQRLDGERPLSELISSVFAPYCRGARRSS